MRMPVLGLYSWMFDCKFDECTASSYEEFPNLNQYFIRTLKPGMYVCMYVCMYAYANDIESSPAELWIFRS